MLCRLRGILRPKPNYMRRVLVLNRAVTQGTHGTFPCLMYSKSLKRRLADDRAAGADMRATMAPETREKQPSDDTPRAKAFKHEVDKYISSAIFFPCTHLPFAIFYFFRIIKKTNMSGLCLLHQPHSATSQTRFSCRGERQRSLDRVEFKRHSGC